MEWQELPEDEKVAQFYDYLGDIVVNYGKEPRANEEGDGPGADDIANKRAEV